jgi:hypothetical protein
MTTAHLPDPLDDLRRLGEELRSVFADERTAIGKLDHETLGILAERKRQLADALSKVQLPANHAERPPEVKALFEAIRIEAQANALLARTATDAVRALLGIETQAAGYDRRANQTTTSRVPRLLAAY